MLSVGERGPVCDGVGRLGVNNCAFGVQRGIDGRIDCWRGAGLVGGRATPAMVKIALCIAVDVLQQGRQNMMIARFSITGRSE
jgi:hypothetical protein